MSQIKEAARKALDSLPESATLDDLFEKIIFYAKFDEGLQDIEAGRVVPLEEVKARFKITE